MASALKGITDEEIESIKRNIYFFAHSSISDYKTFPWHKKDKNNNILLSDTNQKNSSQALMIDVFGTLINSKYRDEIISKVFGINDLGWTLQYEFDDYKLLKEHHFAPTSIDVYLKAKNNQFVVECKFTEPDGGSCSQTNEQNGKKQCDGKYALSDEYTYKKNVRCTLTGKKILYWECIRNIYKFDVDNDIDVCPFKGGHYQWMRNFCTAYKLEERFNIPCKTFICYVNESVCPISEKFNNENYLQAINEMVIPERHMKLVTYNNIISTGIEITKNTDENDIWVGLERFFNEKIDFVKKESSPH